MVKAPSDSPKLTHHQRVALNGLTNCGDRFEPIGVHAGGRTSVLDLVAMGLAESGELSAVYVGMGYTGLGYRLTDAGWKATTH